jgi:hypothetical protein
MWREMGKEEERTVEKGNGKVKKKWKKIMGKLEGKGKEENCGKRDGKEEEKRKMGDGRGGAGTVRKGMGK